MTRRKRRGKRIAEHRKKRGLTQDQVATVLDCSPGHYWRIENGKRGINNSNLLTLAALFQCDVKDLDPEVLTAGELELLRIWGDLDKDNRNLFLYLAHELLRLQLGRPVCREIKVRRAALDSQAEAPLRLPGQK